MSADKPRLFLSYARADDEPFVEKLFHDLQTLGFDPWYDRQNMTNDGAPFTQAISEAIVASQRLLFIVGPRSVASKYCEGEWRTALKHCVPVLPLLRLGDYDLLPPELKGSHTVNSLASRPYADVFNEIERLLRDSVRPLTQVEGGAPPPPPGYIERETYLAPLKQALRTGDNLLAITSKQEVAALQGIGGIGKTTLASALCRDCEVRRAFDRILWIELGPNLTVPALPGKMRAAVGGTPDDFNDLDNARASFARHLHGRKTLVVLDDVWDETLVAPFRIGSEDHRLLITTRQKGLVHNLGIQAQAVDRLTADEGRRLLRERSGRTGMDEADLTRIVDTFGGHALALGIAGAWLARNPAHSPADLSARLAQRPDFRDLKLNPTDKNLNLELALNLSYDPLPPAQQAHFRALGVMAGEASFDRSAAAALWELTDALDADDALAALRDAGLLEEGIDGRCTQHPLLRAYARALLDAAGETAAAQARHFAHYAALHGDFDANNNEDRHPLIETDWPNLRAALEWGWSAEAEAAVDLAWALNYFMQMRQSLRERRVVLEAAHAAAERSSYLRGQANTLKALGDVSLRESDLSAARTVYERALPIFEAIGDRVGQANTLRALGDVSLSEADLSAARTVYGQALPIYEAIGSRGGQANTLKALGDVSLRESDLSAARTVYGQALPIYEAIGARLGQANTLKALGDVSLRESDLSAARAYYGQALPIYEAIGARVGQANTLQALGDLSLREDELSAARAYYGQALPIYEAIGARLGQANTLLALGDVSLSESDLSAARTVYERALPIFEAIGDRLGQANTLKSLGDVSLSEFDLSAARTVYGQALPIFEAIGDRLGQANTLKSLGDVSLSESDLSAARTVYGQALPIFEAIGDRLGQANTLQALGDVSLRESELSAARAYYGQALPIFEAIGSRLGQANTLRALGDVSLRESDLSAARAYYGQALPIYEAIGARLGQANTLLALGDVSLREDEMSAARGYYERALVLGKQIGDFPSQLNSLYRLAQTAHTQDDQAAACAYARDLLALAESHPFFRGHPVVAEWRAEFATWGCS